MNEGYRRIEAEADRRRHLPVEHEAKELLALVGIPDDNRAALPRVTLPRNLPDILKRLEDVELEALYREVCAEAERRGLKRALGAEQRAIVRQRPTPGPKIAGATAFQMTCQRERPT